MQFVNINGQPIGVPAEGAKKVSAPKAKGPTEASHKGWLAMGFSPDQLAQARIDHESPAQQAKPNYKPFNEVSYMRTGKPSKIRTKPYFSTESATAACQLAEKSGWKGCHTRPVEKGGSK